MWEGLNQNSPTKDTPRIKDRGPCTKVSVIWRVHCTYFVSDHELVEFRIECNGGEIVLTQCAHAHVCLVCLMFFCCTVKYTSARVDDVVESVSHLCIYL